MRAVDQLLVTRVGMHRRHQTVLDTESVIENLDEGNEAVRRAARVGDHLVLGGVEVGVIDPVDEGGVGAVRRRRDDHERRPRIEVHRGLVAVGEDARRLDDEVDSERLPRKFLRVADLEHLQNLAVDADSVVGCRDRVRQDTENRVVLQQVRHRLQRTEVVDRDDLDVGAARLNRAEEVAPDTSEAVDTHTNRHCLLLERCRVP